MEDRHHHEIDQLLQQIAVLERSLSATTREDERLRLEKCLNRREKRLELMIPFQFRLKLRSLCSQAGVSSNFI